MPGKYTVNDKKRALRAYEQYGNATDAAKHVEPSCRTILRWAKEEGVNRSFGEVQSDVNGADKEVIDRAERLYVAGELSIRDVADILDRPYGTVRSWLQKRGVTRTPSETLAMTLGGKRKERAKKVCRMRAQTDMTWEEIAASADLHASTCMRYWQSAYNPYQSKTMTEGRSEIEKRARKVCRLRYEEGMAWREIADRVDRSVSMCRRYWHSPHNPYADEVLA